MRLFKLTLLWLFVVCALAWPADWAIWRLRSAPMAQVDVTRMVVAPLKGGKEEYYPDGTTTVSCSNSLLPETGQGPCWYLQQHRTVYDR